MDETNNKTYDIIIGSLFSMFLLCRIRFLYIKCLNAKPFESINQLNYGNLKYVHSVECDILILLWHNTATHLFSRFVC